MSQDNPPASPTPVGRPSGPWADERLPPLPQEQWNRAQRIAAANLVNSRRGALRGPFVPMLYSPELLERAQKLGEYLRYHSALPESLREFAILITARHWNQAYEWQVHAPLAQESGLPRHLIEELGAGARPGQMDPPEAAVYDFCTQLHQQHSVSDSAYAAALAVLGENGVVDLCGICGYYGLLAMVMNVAHTLPPPGMAAPFAPPEGV